jgi:asparagine synthase (glutamine-hydrolysing)
VSEALLSSAAPDSLAGQARDALAWLDMGLGDRWLEARDTLHGPGSWRLFSPALRAEVLSQPSPTAARLQKLFDRQDLPGLDRLLAAEMDTQLPDDLLVKMDIASMANGIETRAPFLDHELAEFANRLPVDLKLRQGVTKYLLRKTFASLLPDPLSQRPKQGFSVPIASWLRHDLADCLRDTLTSQATVDRGFYDSANLERTIEEHQNGARDHSLILWRLLMLESWFAAYDRALAPQKEAIAAPL